MSDSKKVMRNENRASLINPPSLFRTRLRWYWKEEATVCEIYADEEKARVRVIFHMADS